jgi:hypothetical protein
MDEDNGSSRGSLLQFVLLLAGPLLALLTYLIAQGNWPHSAAATAAIAIWMAVWWISEAIPLPATALLPIVLLPVLGADVGYARVGQAVEIKQEGEDLTALGKVIGVKREGATVQWTDSANAENVSGSNRHGSVWRFQYLSLSWRIHLSDSGREVGATSKICHWIADAARDILCPNSTRHDVIDRIVEHVDQQHGCYNDHAPYRLGDLSLVGSRYRDQ